MTRATIQAQQMAVLSDNDLLLLANYRLAQLLLLPANNDRKHRGAPC
jgi:hypothetical protein